MRRTFLLCPLLMSALLPFGPSKCSDLPPPAAGPQRPVPAPDQVGSASYYHSVFDGRRTASGLGFVRSGVARVRVEPLL